MKRFFEIFRAGNYPQGTFSEDDVQAIADNYDPGFLEAPITLDHGWGGPAYGWIDELKAEGQRLLASFKEVSDELTSMVANKRYKTHSVEIYNDIDGKGPYLKALAMLGASSPQVKGMAPIEFSEFSEKFPEVQSATIDFDEPAEPKIPVFSVFMQSQLAEMNLSPETFAEKAGTTQQLIDDILNETFDEDIDAELVQSLAELFEQSTGLGEVSADFMEKLKGAIDIKPYQEDAKTFSAEEVAQKIAGFQAQINNLTNELADQKQTSQSFKDENEQIKFARRRSDFVSFVEKQIKDEAKLPPKLKGKAIEMFGHLDGMKAGEDGKATPLALFKEIITGLPEYDFDEQALEEEHENFNSTPPEIAKKAREYAQKQQENGRPVSFTDAVNHVKKQTNQ